MMKLISMIKASLTRKVAVKLQHILLAHGVDPEHIALDVLDEAVSSLCFEISEDIVIAFIFTSKYTDVASAKIGFAVLKDTELTQNDTLVINKLKNLDKLTEEYSINPISYLLEVYDDTQRITRDNQTAN